MPASAASPYRPRPSSPYVCSHPPGACMPTTVAGGLAGAALAAAAARSPPGPRSPVQRNTRAFIELPFKDACNTEAMLPKSRTAAAAHGQQARTAVRRCSGDK